MANAPGEEEGSGCMSHLSLASDRRAADLGRRWRACRRRVQTAQRPVLGVAGAAGWMGRATTRRDAGAIDELRAALAGPLDAADQTRCRPPSARLRARGSAERRRTLDFAEYRGTTPQLVKKTVVFNETFKECQPCCLLSCALLPFPARAIL